MRAGKTTPVAFKLSCLPLLLVALVACGGGATARRSAGAPSGAPSAPSGSATGKAGSLARFSIVDDYLYTLSGEELTVYDLTRREEPREVGRAKVGPDVETIFGYGQRNLLFFGTRTGMLIYDIKKRKRPKFLSKFHHVVSCDPVVVEGNLAYVTLRSASNCRRGRNVLQVFNVGDPSRPVKLKEYEMSSPSGLGIAGNRLYVVDGSAGLKVYDASSPRNLRLRARKRIPEGYDVIPYKDILFLIARDGLYQYAMADMNLNFLSKISISEPVRPPAPVRIPGRVDRWHFRQVEGLTVPRGHKRNFSSRIALVPIQGMIQFPFGQTAGIGANEPLLRRITPIIQKIVSGLPRGARLFVIGHSDPIGGLQVAHDYGLARALTIRNYFIRQGIPARRLGVFSAGANDLQNRTDLKAPENHRITFAVVYR